MFRIVIRILKYTAALILCAILVLAILFWNSLEPETTKSGQPRVEARYLEMRDEVKIAVDVWLPKDLEEKQKIPTLIRATRYWRGLDSPVSAPNYDLNYGEANAFNEAGYALVLVDARGTGASYGSRHYEMTEDEWQDYGEVAEWISQQTWSNGNIGAYGVSYDGNTAEMLTVNQHPAVKAVAPMFNDWNWTHHLIMPGGVKLIFFLEEWGHAVAAMDANDLCGVAEIEGMACTLSKALVGGVKPVDADCDGSLLAMAVKDHTQNFKVFEAVNGWDYIDDPFGPAMIKDASTRTTASGYKEQIKASSSAFYVPVSWLDAATVNGALSRYNTLNSKQQVIIGPWSHGGDEHTDPFLSDDTITEPSMPEQQQKIIDFFDTFLKTHAPGNLESSITYYTLGAGIWHTTKTWPPDGLEDLKLYFESNNQLAYEKPVAQDSASKYTIDYEATTGRRTRWHTNAGECDVVYPDRSEEDKRLLTFTSDPLPDAITLTGSPILQLYLSSDHEDGAIFAYLEDVAPDGRVTYITEGQLRASCRKVSGLQPEYHTYGPYRTFARSDAEPLVPGEVAELAFDLWATSVQFKKGHRIRIALAGADNGNFARYPIEGTPTILVEHNARFASHITLPIQGNG